jgi:hypothetical protein
MHSGWSRPGWLLRQPNVFAARFEPLDGGTSIRLAKSGIVQLWNTLEYAARDNSRAVNEFKL